ncbi:hypothetical protein Csa_004525 [Cucumis sativus]|nr:hypothetical protein Csa_004525 [Cucumis sativus]
MMIGDVEKMVAIGLVWGATNVLMRRGALLWDQALKSSSDSTKPFSSLRRWLKLFSIWQYTLPFFLNLTASATFFTILSHAPISLAVPVTNATTFAAMLFSECSLARPLVSAGEFHQFARDLVAHWIMLGTPFQ